ncbi:MAG: hypothetical protein FJ104_12130, partial [Deltaproteobacteria bacterium]|nr:hypothetical protein [Deltaproteobacteria bacterium]
MPSGPPPSRGGALDALVPRVTRALPLGLLVAGATAGLAFAASRALPVRYESAALVEIVDPNPADPPEVTQVRIEVALQKLTRDGSWVDGVEALAARARLSPEVAADVRGAAKVERRSPRTFRLGYT